MSTKVALNNTPVDTVTQFYQEASLIEGKLSYLNVSMGPFDEALEAQFNKVQELYSKALPTLSNKPVEAQQLTKKNLQIQLLRALVEQNDFQKLLIASVASTNLLEVIPPGIKPVDQVNVPNIGSGRVSHNDKSNQKPIVNMNRVNDSNIAFNF